MGLLVLMLVVVQARPVGATFPGQNGKIAYAVDDGSSGGMDSEIYTSNPTGGKVQVTYNITGKDEFGPDYSPDGKKIAYSGSSKTDYEIYTINVGGGGKSRVTNNDTLDDYPSWGSRP